MGLTWILNSVVVVGYGRGGIRLDFEMRQWWFMVVMICLYLGFADVDDGDVG